MASTFRLSDRILSLAAGEPIPLEYQSIDGSGVPESLTGRKFVLAFYNGSVEIKYVDGIVTDGVDPVVYWPIDGSFSDSLRGRTDTIYWEMSERANKSRNIIYTGTLQVNASAPRILDYDAAPISRFNIRLTGKLNATTNEVLFSVKTVLASNVAPVVVAPTFSANPVATGSTTVGGMLMSSDGTSNAPITARQWLFNGSVIAGATANTYTTSVAGSFTFKTTATNSVGSATATSNAIVVSNASTGTGTTTPVTRTGSLFSAQSPWNSTPVSPVMGTNTVPSANNDPWIEESAYSTKIFTAKSSDTAMIIYGPNGGDDVDIANQLTKGTVTIPRFPSDTSPAVGSDGHCEIFDPFDNALHSFYQLYQTGGKWRTSKYTRTSADGRGFGSVHKPDNSRAAGCSTAGGLLRASEIGLDIVPHALAIGMDRNAFVSGYVYPATLEDYTGWSNYGNIPGHNFPMGALLMLPADFNVDSLGLASSKCIARTLKKYGGYLVDATVGSMNIYAEIGSGWNKFGDSNFGPDMQILKAAMRQVVSTSGWKDRDGNTYTPTALKNMNLLSMRGPWDMAYDTISAGQYDATTDFYQMPATTAASTMKQNLYTHSDTQADRFFEWKKQAWNLNPEPGATYTVSVVGTGTGITIEMGVKKSDYSKNYFGTGKMAPGTSKTITWPNDTGTVSEVYIDKAAGDAATIRMEMVKVV